MEKIKKSSHSKRSEKSYLEKYILQKRSLKNDQETRLKK